MEKTVSCLILFNIEYNKLNKIYRNACDQKPSMGGGGISMSREAIRNKQ